LRVTETAVEVLKLNVVEMTAFTLGSGNTVGELMLGEAGKNVRVAGSLRAPNPTVDDEVATKAYVDTKVGANSTWVPLSGNVQMTGPLRLPIGHGQLPKTPEEAASAGFVMDQVGTALNTITGDNRYVNRTGDSMQGQLQLVWPANDPAPNMKAAPVAWVWSAINAAIGGGNNATTVGGLRFKGGTCVQWTTSGLIYINVGEVFDWALVANGDYQACKNEVEQYHPCGRGTSYPTQIIARSGVVNQKVRVNWLAVIGPGSSCG
jgi:hypothetical protein